jgi:GNAT superfamily N-acetyltransferase
LREGRVRLSFHEEPGEVLQLKDALNSTYEAARVDQQHDPFFTPERFWQRLLDLYLPSKDFGLCAGWLDGEMIGFAFGSVRDRDSSAPIWASAAPVLPGRPGPVQETDVYIFRELNVRPEHQGHGYGRELHDALLDRRPESVAHLLVRKDNDRARRAYFSWGWRRIGELRPFQDAPLMDEMVIALPRG